MGTARSSSDTLMLLLAAGIVLAALAGSPLFFSGAFLACGIALARRPERRAQGAAMAGVALGFFLLVLGYGIGKDLALRDNARANAPAAAP